MGDMEDSRKNLEKAQKDLLLQTSLSEHKDLYEDFLERLENDPAAAKIKNLVKHLRRQPFDRDMWSACMDKAVALLEDDGVDANHTELTMNAAARRAEENEEGYAALMQRRDQYRRETREVAQLEERAAQLRRQVRDARLRRDLASRRRPDPDAGGSSGDKAGAEEEAAAMENVRRTEALLPCLQAFRQALSSSATGDGDSVSEME